MNVPGSEGQGAWSWRFDARRAHRRARAAPARGDRGGGAAAPLASPGCRAAPRSPSPRCSCCSPPRRRARRTPGSRWPPATGRRCASSPRRSGSRSSRPTGARRWPPCRRRRSRPPRRSGCPGSTGPSRSSRSGRSAGSPRSASWSAPTRRSPTRCRSSPATGSSAPRRARSSRSPGSSARAPCPAAWTSTSARTRRRSARRRSTVRTRAGGARPRPAPARGAAARLDRVHPRLAGRRGALRPGRAQGRLRPARAAAQRLDRGAERRRRARRPRHRGRPDRHDRARLHLPQRPAGCVLRAGRAPRVARVVGLGRPDRAVAHRPRRLATGRGALGRRRAAADAVAGRRRARALLAGLHRGGRPRARSPTYAYEPWIDVINEGEGEAAPNGAGFAGGAARACGPRGDRPQGARARSPDRHARRGGLAHRPRRRRALRPAAPRRLPAVGLLEPVHLAGHAGLPRGARARRARRGPGRRAVLLRQQPRRPVGGDRLQRAGRARLLEAADRPVERAGLRGVHARLRRVRHRGDALRQRRPARLGAQRLPGALPRAARAALDEDARRRPGFEPFFYVRSGFNGVTAATSSVFPGDETTDFSEGSGLPSVPPAMLNLAMGGGFTFSTDVGGYLDLAAPRTSPELFTRSTQLASFTAVNRIHNSTFKGSVYPWELGDEVLDAYRRYAKAKVRLVPLVDAWSERAARDGTIGPVRPLVLDDPSPAARSVDDEWLLGRDLLVAPVLAGGARSRPVYLPAGSRWQRVRVGCGASSSTRARPRRAGARSPRRRRCATSRCSGGSRPRRRHRPRGGGRAVRPPGAARVADAPCRGGRRGRGGRGRRVGRRRPAAVHRARRRWPGAGRGGTPRRRRGAAAPPAPLTARGRS